jgi:hypothetical protein
MVLGGVARGKVVAWQPLSPSPCLPPCLVTSIFSSLFARCQLGFNPLSQTAFQFLDGLNKLPFRYRSITADLQETVLAAELLLVEYCAQRPSSSGC